jgi:uncharacterized Zn-binding protein involved in type VI secretion
MSQPTHQSVSAVAPVCKSNVIDMAEWREANSPHMGGQGQCTWCTRVYWYVVPLTYVGNPLYCPTCNQATVIFPLPKLVQATPATQD